MLSMKGLLARVFPEGLRLVPDINELYELELAYEECNSLDEQGLIDQAAYVSHVGDQPTRHFQLCVGGAVKLSEWTARQAFFTSNAFRTGYATHGLFPYRGKFHPQMVRGILNVLGLRPGSVVLDPMAGSGTTLVEAAIMGIRSIGIDVSPFCKLLASTKIDALDPSAGLAALSPDVILDAFQRFHTGGRPDSASERVLYLAYLDALGYSRRMPGQSLRDLYLQVVRRYAAVVDKFHVRWQRIAGTIAPAEMLEGDARSIPLPDDSIDGILFSPPYSFAIDYAENDRAQLQHLGYDVGQLRNKMIGLRGQTSRLRVVNYLEDMTQVLSECHRVLRPGAMCAIVIGTNSNQLARALNASATEVSLQSCLIEEAEKIGLGLVRCIPRQILGMANTMRHEDILFFAKRQTC